MSVFEEDAVFVAEVGDAVGTGHVGGRLQLGWRRG